MEYGNNNKPHYHIIISCKNILGFNKHFVYNIKNYFIKELNEYDIVVELIEDFNNYKNKFKYIIKEQKSIKELNLYMPESDEYKEMFSFINNLKINQIKEKKYANLNSFSKINNNYDEYTLINLINFYFSYKNIFLCDKILYKKISNKLISYEKFMEFNEIPKMIKFFYLELLMNFSIQLENLDMYALQVQFVPKIEQILKKTEETITNVIKLNFDLIEFNDGIYILSKNKFIKRKILENYDLRNLTTKKYYNKTYKNLTIPEKWKKLIDNTLEDPELSNDFFLYYATLFNRKDDLLGKKKTMYILGESSTGKTTLTTKVLFKFFGQENIGLISNNNLFGLENIINKKCIICDEAHHYSFNGGQILKLLEKGNPLLVERKHKEAIITYNTIIVFISNKEINLKENESQEAFSNRIKIFKFKTKLPETTQFYRNLIEYIENEEINIIIYCNKLFFKKYKNDRRKLRNNKTLIKLLNE